MTETHKTEPVTGSSLLKTTVVVEVLHEGPIEWDTIADLHELGTSGDVSLRYGMGDVVALTKEEFIAECERHGTDPEFFGLD